MVTAKVPLSEQWRLRHFAGHPAWARWGTFSARVDDVVGIESTAPIVCGVCGKHLDDPEAKAHHLRVSHAAVVKGVTSNQGESMWEWSR